MENGYRIKELRNKQGMTQGDLANKAGLTVAALSRVENGHSIPSLDNYIKIIEVLGYEVDLKKKGSK